ncbi:MAG: fibrobacter succinogenes major paralogous domain-containing protein [Muribaculaceae bacterium]|nr:fibrobacter succinogenes major paralogous domain-containing protein [Muribaculaceae bacterium]
MTNNIFKAKKTGVFVLMGMLGLAACSDKEEMSMAGGGNEESDFSIVLRGMPAAPAGAPAASGQEALSVFQFGPEGLFSKNVINSYDPEGINLVKGTTRTLYCVSGIDIDASEEMTQAEFALTAVTTEEGAISAPLFLSACTPIEASQMNCELTMKRGVARIDLDARDADMEISSITVDDAPASTYVFARESAMPDAGSTVYTYEYAQAPTGVEKGVFMIFESDREVHVSVHGSVEGTEITVPAVIESVERNKVYTLRVYDKNATVKAGFTMSDWEEGDSFNGAPDTTRGLCIDPEASVFPEGVTVDYVNQIIEIPDSGVKGMKIAFASEMRVDIDTICYSGERVAIDSIEAKHVKFTAEKAYNTDKGVVTRFNVDINSQLKGRPDYEMKMYVKKTVMNTSYDYVTIRVAPSRYQIPTVELAGIKWMAFNATSPDVDDQIYVDEGKTVEDMYVDDWVSCTGGLFQFGRKYRYIPYQSYNPCNDLGEQKQDIPWIHESHMPCPEGYHVATIDEWHTLFPEGTRVEIGSYTAGNGEKINVDIIRLPGDVVTPTNVNGVCRYMKLTSEETGNCLILPLAGWKGDKSTAATANFGRDAVYWGNDNNGCWGGYARAMRFMFNWGYSCMAETFQFEMEAFAYVRAVKND